MKTANQPAKDYWRFVERTAKQAEQLPQWMKGGTSTREPAPTKVSEPPPKKSS